MVPLVKIPGEINIADLTTKHLGKAVILKHLRNLHLKHTTVRAEAVANLHALRPSAEIITNRSNEKSKVKQKGSKRSEILDVDNVKEFSGAPRGDHWSERGEHGRWVRVHSTPRGAKFDPWRAQNGPGRKTRLRPSRRTIGLCDNGETFDVTDDWRSREPNDDELPSGWTGRSISLVDRGYTRDFGTDQSR